MAPDCPECRLAAARQRVRLAREALRLRPADPLGELRLRAALNHLEQVEAEELARTPVPA